jgi:chorismate mutase
MDYYTELKKKVDEALSRPTARVGELRKQIDKAQKQLTKEVDNSVNLSQRIAKLKSIAGEKIADSQSSYEQFKVSLKKLHADEQVSSEIVAALRDEFIPKLRDKYNAAKNAVVGTLEAVLRNNRHICKPIMDAATQKILDELDHLVSERKSLKTAFIRFYGDYDIKQVFGFDPPERCEQFLPPVPSKEDIAVVYRLLKVKTAEPVVKEPEPVKETVTKPEPVEPVTKPEPIEPPVIEKPKPFLCFRRECEKCHEDFQTADSDVTLCPVCLVEAKRLKEAESAIL